MEDRELVGCISKSTRTDAGEGLLGDHRCTCRQHMEDPHGDRQRDYASAFLGAKGITLQAALS